jgi:hypothetical protein
MLHYCHQKRIHHTKRGTNINVVVSRRRGLFYAQGRCPVLLHVAPLGLGFVVCARAIPCAVVCRPFRAGALGSALKGRDEIARGSALGIR